MSSKCVNFECRSSKNGKKLVHAQRIVCNYYHVPFKPYQRVCGVCLETCMLHYHRIGKDMKNQECIFNGIFPNPHRFIDLLSDDDDVDEDNVSSENIQETTLRNHLNTVWNVKIDDVVRKQQQKCIDFMANERVNLTISSNQVNKSIKQINEDLGKICSSLYKYDSHRQFHYAEEVHIVDHNPYGDSDNGDKNAVVVMKEPLDLPQGSIPRRRSLKSGDKVYAMKFSLFQPWYEATVESVVDNTNFNISFGGDGGKKVLNYKCLAYANPSNSKYPVGSRIIAKFKDKDISITDNFYAGVIAEPPKYLNNFRYMIFFDDGYTQYVCHQDIRLICRQSNDVSDDVHENIREFVKSYLEKFPELIMVRFKKRQAVRTELNGEWFLAKVTNVDASLVQLKFHDLQLKHTEWMYRGSNRLFPIYSQISKNKQDLRSCTPMVNVNKTLNRPYIELENSLDDVEVDRSVCANNETNRSDSPDVMIIDEIPFQRKAESGFVDNVNLPTDICMTSTVYRAHICNCFCLQWINYDAIKTKTMTTLSIPLHFGFERSIIKMENSELKTVLYKTPCGVIIKNENDMLNYLKATEHGENVMTINFFNFDSCLNPLALFKVTNFLNHTADISNQLEFKPISMVNCLDNSNPPDMTYITKRKIKPGVNLNVDRKFLCGCDCTDNCEDKSKCSCWLLTYECQKKFPLAYKDKNIGYINKRLYEAVYTGIYECNDNCKCKKTTCLNRVVQEPLSASLQLFLTDKKGWGVRTLTDIPKGTYVCTYIGEVNTEKDAEKDGVKYGDEYLADLDCIERSEEIKEGYESDVNECDTESDSDSIPFDDEEEDEFIPGPSVRNKTFEVRKSLRKNVQNTYTKTDGKHQLSKLNVPQKNDTRPKSVRSYLDKDCGIYILDAKVCGNIGRYFNHSCDPNIFVQNVFVDTHDLRFPWVSYFASTFISAGTELTWDYSYIVGSVKGKELTCFCKSKNCRGRLL